MKGNKRLKVKNKIKQLNEGLKVGDKIELGNKNEVAKVKHIGKYIGGNYAYLVEDKSGKEIGQFMIGKDGALKTFNLNNETVYVREKDGKYFLLQNKYGKDIGRFKMKNGKLEKWVYEIGGKKLHVYSKTGDYINLRDENGKEIGRYEIKENGKLEEISNFNQK